MKKIDGKSMDIVAKNIEKLKTLFPDVFTEGMIDFEALEAMLGEYVEREDERYSFTWNGKARARRIAQTPSTGTLRPAPEESKNWDTTQNLYIEGDNLEVLKLLQKSYHKQVKMIYIDPPYNTGKDFVYKDNFKDNIKNYLEQTGQVDSEGKKLSTNSDTSGRYHSNWLNMMYPRLKLARNLLKDDGVIFISIDDNEVANLRKICDEIFGEENFVDNIIWKKRYGGGAKEKYLVTLHEYVLVYSKDINKLEDIFIPLSDESIKRYYKLKDENFAKRGPYRTHPLEAGKAVDARPNLVFDIVAPDGSIIKPKRQWYWNKERVENAIQNNELEFIQNKVGEWSVHSKQYLKDINGIIRQAKAFSLIDDVYSQHGTNEIIDLFGNAKIFSYPKPSAFISKLLDIGLQVKSDDIILDFFSGSGSTAHAIYEKNLDDGGNRRFILIQLPEKVEIDSDPYNAGYNTIAEIGKERIRRAGEKIKEENADKEGIENLDIGFKVFKLDSSNIKAWDPDYEDFEKSLWDTVDNIKEGRTEADLLYEILLKYGLDLTLPIEELELAGKKVYVVGLGSLVICLDEQITLDTVEEIAKLKEKYEADDLMRVVFRDNGFKDAEVKTNAIQILKQFGIDDVKSM